MPAMTARLRWLVGGGAVAAAAALVVGGILVLGARPVPDAMTYVPRDSAIVAELRPDLPGDQLSKIGNLLAHFPGFKDQSILAQKIDETLAKITRSATNGSVDYASQVKPWLAGPLYAGASATLSLAPGPIASGAGSGGGGSPSVPTGDYVVVFTTDGSVSCQSLVHGGATSESYRGIQISEPTGPSDPSCAIDGRQALVGTTDELKAALDAHAEHQGIDGLADYRTARDRLGADRLATLYISRSGMDTSLQAALQSAAATLEPATTPALAALPAWVMAGIRAEDNALVADVVTAPYNLSVLVPGAGGTGSLAPAGSPAPVVSFLTAPPAHASQVASLVPGDTALLYELHGAGVTLQNALSALRSTPGVGGSVPQLDATLGPLGGVAGLLGWVGDAGIVVMPDGAAATAGLVLVAPDAATASAKVDQVRGLLGLAGLGAGFTVTDTTIDGTTVTLVDLGDASKLLGSLGPLTPGATGGLAIPSGTHVVLSIAAHGATVLIGSGESFARRILETAAGSTLADQASYQAALALAPAQNDGQLFLAAAPTIALAEGAIPPADKARYDSDIKPYLAPLGALLETTTSDAAGLRIRLVLTAK